MIIISKENLFTSECILKSNVRSVGILLDRGWALISTIYSAFENNITYVPIDPLFPDERISYIIEEEIIDVVITSEKYKYRAVGCETIVVKEDDVICFSKICPNNEIAYVLHTSGSTGEPKGVMVRRESVLNFIEGVSEVIDFSEGRSIACLTTVSFDIFFLESIMALRKGLTVYLATETEQNNAKAMASFIEKSRVDIIQLTPSRMQMLMNYDEELSCLKCVKDILIGGEVFPLNMLRSIQEKTSANVYNMYGPTETTIWSTVSNLTNKTEIDIGSPIKNTKVYILNKNLHEVPVGEIGEICISGKGLALGYVNDDELTQKKFVYLPNKGDERIYHTGDIGKILPGGEIQFLGRLDSQVKIRGHRVELGEIETFINQIDGIMQSVVRTTENGGQGCIIEAYYTCDKEVTGNEIREYLLKKLPPYMLPAKYFQMEAFEQTVNGKIDRKKLQPNLKKEMSIKEHLYNIGSSSVYNEIYDVILDSVRAVLKVPIENISIDSFLSELEIDSISFVKLVILLESKFDFEFDDDKLVISEFSTLSSIAEYIKMKQATNREISE